MEAGRRPSATPGERGRAQPRAPHTRGPGPGGWKPKPHALPPHPREGPFLPSGPLSRAG